LASVNFPVCTSIGYGAFQHGYSLINISFPNCTSIGGYAFAQCSSLTTANFPSCTTIGDYAFQYCTTLTSISFPACTFIGYAFGYCYNLLSLYLLGSSVCSLAGVNAFVGTPIFGYTSSTGGVYGSIYVPASLLASYKTATNWAAYSSRFVGV